MRPNSIQFQLEKFKAYRYSGISWDQLQDVSDQDRAFASSFVEEFGTRKRPCLYVSTSLSGTGKSSFAVCLAYDLIRAGKLKVGPLYIPHIKLMNELRQDKGSYVDSELFQTILLHDFLIFDDIGVERLTPSIAERYYIILEYLWLERGAAIFTSKFTINELVNRGSADLDPNLLGSIGSRLEGLCLEYELQNVNVDYRNND
jgi:DNA replication protein DnaC